MTSQSNPPINRLLTDQLRDATRPQHERLHHLVDLSSMTLDSAQYGQGLLKYWQFVFPLESQLRNFLHANSVHDDIWQERLTKCDWLQKDLQTLQMTPPLDSISPIAAPELKTLDDFVGISYVLEGMTLGGQGISKQIERKHPEWSGQATHFFRSYGSSTLSYWRAWQEWANQQSIDVERTVGTAQGTFDYFVHVWKS